MKNMFKSMAILAFASSLSFAGDTAAPAAPAPDKDLAKKIQDQGIYVESTVPGVTLSGYVDAGYDYSPSGPTAGTVANTRPLDGGNLSNPGGGFSLNAFKLALEKTLGDKNDWNAGFRADLMFGQDAKGLSGTGINGTDPGRDLFVEQAFVDFRAPVGNGIDFKVGRFVALAGYEVIERPSNLNITYGNLFVNAIPLYHQGVEAAYKFNDTINVAGAVVNGWNNTTPGLTGSASDPTNTGAYGVIGQVNVNSAGGNANITNTTYLGVVGASNTLGNLPAPGYVRSTPSFVEDIWGNWKPKFAGDKLLLGFNGDYGTEQYNTGIESKSEEWYGAALYSQYQFTKIFSLAGRADWIHNGGGAKWADANALSPTGTGNVAPGLPGDKNNDLYSYTLTAGFSVWDNLLLRAEYRIDWGNDWGVNPTNVATPGGTSTTSKWGASHLFAAEVVYSF